MNDLVKGGLYKHYKGMNYIVHDVVLHSETLEELVYYECLYDNKLGQLWVRPLTMFLEDIIINDKTTPRFTYIGDKKGNSQL